MIRFKNIVSTAGLLFAGLMLATAPAIAEQDGPVVELPPELDPGAPSAESADALTRGLKDQRLKAPSPIGGYGELHFNMDLTDPDDPDSTIDLHRLVLFVAHDFGQGFRLYTELEVEHALVGDGQAGEVGIEQAQIDWIVLGPDSPVGELGLRAGIVLVPMGIINQWHEPPIFHGVERPNVDKAIIPTTWREAGVGLFGQPTDWMRYELYLVSGLDPSRFRASDGLRKGRQAIAEAIGDGFAVTGRLEFEPLTSLVIGLSGYLGQAGPNLRGAFAPSGEKADLDVWVSGLALDARGRWAGLEARAVFATFFIGDTPALRGLVDEAGESLGLDVGAQLLGGYGELAYDVLHLADTGHQLLPFVRVEYYDTLEDIQGRARTDGDDDRQKLDLIFGLSYRPIAEIVFKADLIRRLSGGDADDQTILNFGTGFMF
jgi:hypothetical protein